MADDRMKDDDRQRNMGNKEDQDFGRQAPGRSDQPGQQGGQKGSGKLDDDEDIDTGGSGRTGGQNRGGQDR